MKKSKEHYEDWLPEDDSYWQDYGDRLVTNSVVESRQFKNNRQKDYESLDNFDN